MTSGRQEQSAHDRPSIRQLGVRVSSMVGGGVLGVLTVSVLLAAESATRETYAETAAAVGLAMMSYWLAHSYAAFASRRIRHAEPLAARGLARGMLHELPLVAGAAIPLGAVLACWVAGVSLDTGIKTALLTAVVLIVVLELVAGLRAGLQRRELLIQTLVGAALGLLVLALRLVLH